jgi:hypothetical protein
MSPSRRIRLVTVAVAWAVIGVLGGHLAAYAILFPDAHVHDRVLDQSGHGWIALAGPAALTALTIALGFGLVTGADRGRARGVRFGTLLGLQVVLFTGMELTEHIAASGLSLAHIEHQLLSHGLAGILVLGTLCQVVTAWLGSAFSRVVAAVAAARHPRARPRRRCGQHCLLPITITRPMGSVALAHRGRGPPRMTTPIHRC